MNGSLLWSLVAVIGALGAVARYQLDAAVSRRSGAPLPLGTLTVNTLGSLALGVIVGAGTAHDPRFLMGGAFLGSFTTFSTWMFETHRLGEDAGGIRPLTNVLLSAALGLAAAGGGWALGAWLW
ncbi:MAG: fluoride efflux transporter CrcB [Thermoleophilia bacterium]